MSADNTAQAFDQLKQMVYMGDDAPPEFYLQLLDSLRSRMERQEERIQELEGWGRQIHDALDGKPLPSAPSQAAARISNLLREAPASPLPDYGLEVDGGR